MYKCIIHDVKLANTEAVDTNTMYEMTELGKYMNCTYVLQEWGKGWFTRCPEERLFRKDLEVLDKALYITKVVKIELALAAISQYCTFYGAAALDGGYYGALGKNYEEMPKEEETCKLELVPKKVIDKIFMTTRHVWTVEDTDITDAPYAEYHKFATFFAGRVIETLH